MIMLDHSQRDGYRDYNSSERTSLDFNVGAALSDNINTRFFAGYTDLSFDVAGPLTKDELYRDPKSVHAGPVVTPQGAINPGPNVVRDRPQRETTQYRIGNRTTATFGDHILDMALGYSRTEDEFRFPISAGVRTTDGDDLSTVLRYAYNPDTSAALPLFESSLRYAVGWADRSYHHNKSGKKGELFGENELDSSTLAFSAGLNVPVGNGFTVSPAVTLARATRDNDDTYNAARRSTIAYAPASPNRALPNGSVATEDTGYSRTYTGVSPSLGVSYTPNDNHMFFGAVSRSFEPPTHDDLLATINGTPNSSPGRPNPANPATPSKAFTTPDLDAQTATTLEAGWRGTIGKVSFDTVTYYSWVDNEILSLRDTSGNSLGAMNADKTRHFGIELGSTFKATDDITLRLAYTYQDFRFQDDPVRGDNRLAGAPRHVLDAVVRYNITPDVSIQTDVKWHPGKTPVDNMNTLYADSWVIVGLRSSWNITENISIYGEARNIFDETYAASTLVVDQARSDQAAFLPGDGRSFYAGVKVTF